MRKYILKPLLLVIVLFLTTAASLPDKATGNLQAGQIYFQETGHWVVSDFLTQYQSVSDPQIIYGFPITDAYQEQTKGCLVQYFEHSRFEQCVDNPPELPIVVTPLGQLTYTPGPVLDISGIASNCHFFPETEHRICFAFLDFFNNHGGAPIFGYPISEIEFHDNLIVQYFQRARFEWHPDRPSGHKVVLSDLGLKYFHILGEDPIRLSGLKINNGPERIVLTLKAHAFARDAVLPTSGQQTVFIIIQDQGLESVANAEASAIIEFPSGQIQRLLIPAFSNENGIISFNFSYKDETPGLVKITIDVSRDGLETTTNTSFHVWW